jgi:lipopolysaccharide transport system ATP-binding protein
MSTVISVENVSKAYRLGQISGGTLKEDVARWWAKLRGKPDPLLKIGEEHHARHMGEQFWALDNVSFEVKQGEVLGIIGRNGAGKSTLLKILSQVTTPTSGQIKIKGRIASLLEVGTGFNPEMTGRENVFLNGAILGMTKAEIRGKFDEIVAFSEIEEFIDTPVKRYSSGMYVRLAFAVAAHLEPEILICDEVLAVGDAAFQKKCIGKMQDIAGHGRTILFVSHNMGAVLTLCNKAIWLADGRSFMTGTAREVGNAYLNSNTVISQRRLDLGAVLRTGTDGSRARLIAVEWMDGVPLRHGCPVRIRLEITFSSATEDIRLGIGFSTTDGTRVVTYDSDTSQGGIFSVDHSSDRSFELLINELPLNPGLYSVDVGCRSGEDYGLDYLKGAGLVEVVPGPNTPSHYFGKESAVRLHGQWKSDRTHDY